MPLVVFLVGCGKSKADCKADVDALMKLLRGIDHEGQMIHVGEHMHLVERTDLPKRTLTMAPVVIVEAAATTFQGEPFTPAALVAQRAKIEDDAKVGRIPMRVLADMDLHQLFVEVDRDARWSEVVAVAQAAAAAGFDHLDFVFGRPVTWQPPPRSSIDDQLDKLRHEEGGNLATELAKMISTEVESCPAMKKAFGAVGSEEGGDKAAIIIEATGESLIDCNCKVDMPRFRSIMYFTLVNEHPVVPLRIQLAPGGKAIELPAATPWHDAYTQLAPAAVVSLVAR